MITIHEDILQHLQKMAVKFCRSQRIPGIRLDSGFKKVKIEVGLFANRYKCQSRAHKRIYNKWSEQNRS